jgi:hypothetical protein
MASMLRRRRNARRALKLALLLAALDNAARDQQPASRRAGRVSLSRA